MSVFYGPVHESKLGLIILKEIDKEVILMQFNSCRL